MRSIQILYWLDDLAAYLDITIHGALKMMLTVISEISSLKRSVCWSSEGNKFQFVYQTSFALTVKIQE